MIEENQASLRMPRPSLVSIAYLSVDVLFGLGILGRRSRAFRNKGSQMSMRKPVNSNLHRCFVSRTWIGLGQIYGGFVTDQVSSALATSRSPILPTEKEVNLDLQSSPKFDGGGSEFNFKTSNRYRGCRQSTKEDPAFSVHQLVRMPYPKPPAYPRSSVHPDGSLSKVKFGQSPAEARSVLVFQHILYGRPKSGWRLLQSFQHFSRCRELAAPGNENMQDTSARGWAECHGATIGWRVQLRPERMGYRIGNENLEGGRRSATFE
ncbi:hypothetical protein CSIM01_04021 [Colletotrichum simmondsii]|uniref:Uncharacterized protein n=1 Tax=Colletotrichum simmondsii TaxID=703756 RepID=A0A135S657_9PEZI|nr:hypothetical protein CSIM01_04021 [Colletotrichum simmondsii]